MRNGGLVDAKEPSKDRTEWRRLQEKNSSVLCLIKRKAWPSATERAVGKYARAAFSKRKRNRTVGPEHRMVREERVKVSESCTLASERGIIAGGWKRKDELHRERRQIPRSLTSPTSKARREASRNEFMEKGGIPDSVESFRETNSSEDRPRARPGYTKLIRNGLKKIQNLI